MKTLVLDQRAKTEDKEEDCTGFPVFMDWTRR
jgi:hypothetical protein